jgi:hypothetical protein
MFGIGCEEAKPEIKTAPPKGLAINLYAKVDEKKVRQETKDWHSEGHEEEKPEAEEKPKAEETAPEAEQSQQEDTPEIQQHEATGETLKVEMKEEVADENFVGAQATKDKINKNMEDIAQLRLELLKKREEEAAAAPPPENDAEDEEDSEDSSSSESSDRVMEEDSHHNEAEALDDRAAHVENQQNFYSDIHKLSSRISSAVDRASEAVTPLQPVASSLLMNHDQHDKVLKRFAEGARAFTVGVKHFQNVTAKKHKANTAEVKQHLKLGLEAGLQAYQRPPG